MPAAKKDHPKQALSKYEPERIQTILDTLAAGNTRRAACAVAGIDETTFANWLRGYSDFSARVKAAESSAEIERLNRIRAAGIGGAVTRRKVKRITAADGSVTEEVEEQRSSPQWQADAWAMERRNPEDWGRRDRILIEQKQIIEDARKKAKDDGLDPDEVAAELEAILSGAGPSGGQGRGK